MSASSGKKSSSSASTRNSRSDSTTSGTNGKKRIREFLYLDFPKLTSYFAQILEGLPTSQSMVSGGGERKLTREPETEVSFSSRAGVDLGDSDLNQVTVAKLLGVMARIDANISWLIRTRGREVERNEAQYLIQNKELHHEVFAQVEATFYGNDLVSVGDDEPSKPFSVFTGTAELIDFDYLTTFTKDFGKLGQTFSRLTGQSDFGKGIKNTKEIASVLERFYKGRVGLIVYEDGLIVTTNLHPDHLTAPAQFIADNYGRQSQVKVTVFGLKTGSAYPAEETSGKVAFLGEAEDPFPGLNLGTMARSVIQLNRGLEGMDRFFRVRGAVHVYPIAVYIDL